MGTLRITGTLLYSPQERWPEGLRAAASMVAASPQPMVVLWGAGLLAVPNAAAATVAAVDACALIDGPTLWGEAWMVVEPSAIEAARGDAAVVDVDEWCGAPARVSMSAVEGGGVLCVIERRTREEAALDRLSVTLCHDLRAPLRVVSQLVEGVEDDLRAGVAVDDALAHVAVLRDRVRRLGSLVDGVVAYGSAAEPTPVETFSAAEMLSDVVSLLSARSEGSVTIDDAMPTLTTERVALQRVLLNLVNNALTHAGREGATVEVAAEVEGEMVRFSVRDDGPGIAPCDRERIWSAFETLGREGSGAGLGLAVVRRLVESKGGRAWVEDREGGGATFSFTWPRGR